MGVVKIDNINARTVKTPYIYSTDLKVIPFFETKLLPPFFIMIKYLYEMTHEKVSYQLEVNELTAPLVP